MKQSYSKGILFLFLVFYFSIDSFALPVRFVQFSAILDNGSIDLIWKIADEYELKAYKIERSTDGLVWQELTVIPTKSSYTYSWKDATPLAGKSLYRVRAVDVDGHYKVSRVVSISQELSSFKLAAAPNPANAFTDLSISIPSNSKLLLQLTNATGCVIRQRALVLEKGSHVVRISDLGNLFPGLYHLIVRSSDAMYSKSLNILKQ